MLLDEKGPSYLGTVPSKKQCSASVEQSTTRPGRDTVWLDSMAIVERPQSDDNRLGQLLLSGPVSKAYSAVDPHARTRLRRWLCDKHNEPRPAYKRFSEAALHSVFGLVQLSHRTANLPSAKA